MKNAFGEIKFDIILGEFVYRFNITKCPEEMNVYDLEKELLIITGLDNYKKNESQYQECNINEINLCDITGTFTALPYKQYTVKLVKDHRK